ncbi:MAG TPA: hypothetical protein VNR00_17010 [Opitutus sp.]|nr:hypothetical protein [Opitutus sp.]
MEPPHSSFPPPYEGLSVRSADVFPLACTRCQRRFTDIKDFIARTTPVFQSSGLMEREDAAGSSFVLLLRNCLCGTSLALRCQDRRDRSEAGQQRRQRFAPLVELLVDSGFQPEQAQAEARRLLRGSLA